jgi:hypothetical protein
LEGSDFPGRDCPAADHFYTFDYGPCHYIFLAYEGGGGAFYQPAFLSWLEKDLQQTTAAWKIVVLHPSIFDSGGLFVRAHVEDNGRIYDWGGEHAFKYKIAPLLEKYGVDLVLSGHNHCYDRTYPVISRGGLAIRNDKQGLVYMVASANYSRCGSMAFPWMARTDLPQVDSRGGTHYIYLEADRNKLSVKYILQGKERDYYLKVKSPDYEDKLIADLSSSDIEVVKSALRELGALASLKAVSTILELLDGAGEDLKVDLIEALANIGDKRVLDVTNQYLKSGEVKIRRSAVRLLARYGGKEAIPWLWEAVEDSDKEVKSWAILGLTRLAGGTAEVDNLVDDWYQGGDMEIGKRGYHKATSDEDGDGVPFWYEVTTHMRAKQNDANGDIDGDGLTNYEEYLLWTSANSTDTDGDGVNDNEDLDPLDPEISVGVDKINGQIKRTFLLPYPNPFNPECYIPINAKCQMQNAKCKIYNILGQVVREIEISNLNSQISKSIYWDGKDSQGLEVPSGIYFYEIGEEKVRRMVVLK